MSWLRIFGLEACNECGIVRELKKMKYHIYSIGLSEIGMNHYISFCPDGCIDKYYKKRRKVYGGK